MSIDLDAVRHPDWGRMHLRWLQAYDFWRGGIHVLSPEYAATKGHRARMITADVDGTPTDLRRALSLYEWESASAHSYLWRHMKEIDEEFSDRQRRQWHYPIFQRVVNIFASGTLRSQPNRPDVTGMWAAYHADVDTCRTNFGAFIRHSFALALVFGRVHSLTDRTASSGSSSLLEQLERGERAYSSLVTPLDLVDWAQDRHGNFIWIRIRENDSRVRSWDAPPIEQVQNQYRIWDTGGWELWRAQEVKAGDTAKKWNPVEEGMHPCGRVPLSTLTCSKDDRPVSMACESPLADILDADRSILNDVSELNEIDRLSSFPMLWLPEDAGQLGPIDVGPNRAMAGPSEAGAPRYVEPNPGIASGLAERIKNKLQDVLAMSGASRGKSEYSKEERSSAALSVEKEDTHNQMAHWIAGVQEYDEDLHRNAALWEGDNGTLPIGEYPRDFDTRSVSVKIQDLVQLNVAQVLGPRASAMLAKPVVGKILRGHGMSDDEIAQAMEDIDDHAREAGQGGVEDRDPEITD